MPIPAGIRAGSAQAQRRATGRCPEEEMLGNSHS
ncbi:hypothetical protein RHECNPAF_1740020 [Rhizobium etli CNPAF512]|nr:hypothetical protein RHECNPAF_1740020 [Rhizobium etli CNPAF512]